MNDSRMKTDGPNGVEIAAETVGGIEVETTAGAAIQSQAEITVGTDSGGATTVRKVTGETREITEVTIEETIVGKDTKTLNDIQQEQH